MSKLGQQNKNAMQQVYDWFKTLTIDQAKTFLQQSSGSDGGGRIYSCTCGAQDVLFLPMGWTYYEVVGSSADYVGARMVLARVSDLPAMTELNQQLMARDSPNELLQKCVDFLAR